MGKGLLLLMMGIAFRGGITALREGGACGRPGAVVMTGSHCTVVITGPSDIGVEVHITAVCVAGLYRCGFVGRPVWRWRAGNFCRRITGVTRKHCKVVVIHEYAGVVHIAWS